MIQEVMAVSLALLVVVCSYVYMKFKRPRGFPPGPPAYPFLGSLPALEMGPSDLDQGVQWHLALNKLKEQYGPVFSIALGHQWVVILSDYASMKEAFVTNGNTISERPPPMSMSAAWNTDFTNLGIAEGMYDDQWKLQHLAALQAMKNLGFGREKGEAFVQEEVDILIETLKSREKQSIKIADYIAAGVTNVVLKFLFGQRLDYDDEELKLFRKNMYIGFQALQDCLAVEHIPFSNLLPSCRKDLKDLYQGWGGVNQFMSRRIEENPIDENAVQPRSFIEAYHMERRKNPELEDKHFQIVSEICQAGIEPTGNILSWSIFHLVTHQEVQRKLQKEIDTVIGRSRKPRVDDIMKLPYMMATVNETLRLGCVLPTTLPHCTLSTCQVGGYTIPKNTQVWGNTWDVLRDPNTWEDPLDFKPERFLDAKGQLIKIEEFIPFGIGPRACLGQLPARQILHLSLINLLQIFTFTASKGSDKPTSYGAYMSIHKPPEYEIYATTRD